MTTTEPRSLLSGAITTVGAVALAGLAVATPAGAISSISNSIGMSRSSLDTGQNVGIYAKTNFGSSTILPNPYYSNFRTAVNAKHFYRPSPYSENCEGDAFYLTSSDGTINGDPAFRFDCGTFWVMPDKERHVNSHANTRYEGTGTGTRASAQGQFDRGSIASYGATDIFRTTFSAK